MSIYNGMKNFHRTVLLPIVDTNFKFQFDPIYGHIFEIELIYGHTDIQTCEELVNKSAYVLGSVYILNHS